MWRFSPRGRITVTPVFLLGRHFTPETSTPLSDKRSTQNFPRGSPPMQEVKPTRLPRRAILWAKIAEELPRVIAKSLARSSLSGSSTGGRPYRIKSQFSSPRTFMSKRFTPVVSLFLQQFYLNALLNARNFLSQNATRECRQAIRSAAGNGKRKASLKGQFRCGSVR